jgi:TRAP-type mannitol/chloroaromatic compound transport system permease small subunit
MRLLTIFLRIIDTTSEWTGKIVSFGIVIIIGSIIYAIILRSVFDQGSTWGIMTSGRVFFIYILFGSAYVYQLKAHVNMDILYRHFSPRTRSIVDMVTFVSFLLFVVVMLYTAVEEAALFGPMVRLSVWNFLPPFWPNSLLAPVGISLLLLQGLSKFVRDSYTAVTGRELA